MAKNKILSEVSTISIAALALAISLSFYNKEIFWKSILAFAIILFSTSLVKKLHAYSLEADTETRFWSWYHYGFKKGAHFKKPLPMVLVTLLLTPFRLNWLGIIETDIIARTERVSKRHGLYRFSEMTDWHIALILTSGILTSLFISFVAYLLGFELLTKIGVYYSLWSIIPIGKLDGTKIFFGSRILWTALALFILIVFGWTSLIL